MFQKPSATVKKFKKISGVEEALLNPRKPQEILRVFETFKDYQQAS